jgi:hypothetical protein
MANVVVAWQSVVGGSATTPKLSVPPRLGVSAASPAPPVASKQTPASTPAVTADLITGFTRFLPGF